MAELDSPARSAEDARQPRLERAEVDPVRRFLEDAEGEPSRPGAEGIPVGAAAEVDVEEPLLPRARLEGGEQLVRIPARDRGVRIGAAPTERVECDLPVERLEVGSRAEATDDRGERKHDLPLVACVGGKRQRRRRVVGHVSHRRRVDGQVVVRALERRGRRQDHVRLTGRLVEIEVDADEALELAERRLQPPAVRIAERRVAGERDERAQPPLARSVDLLCEAGERQLAEHLGQAAHAAVPTPRRDARAAARLAR